MAVTLIRPVFTILLTCLNEEKRIGAAISSLLDEYFRAHGEMIVLDGGSTDRTREIVQNFANQGWNVRLVHNPGRIQSEGLNIGLREAKGAFIIRADAHCLYPVRYAERCIEMLSRADVFNAGGVMFPAGEGYVQKAVALAMRHPVGVGDAKYHLGNYQGYYNGVYLGAFKREIFDRVGEYDPNVHPNEDADLNMRILEAGGKIWLDGSLRVTYFPRDTFGKLFVQYFNYGKGRLRTTIKHRKFTSWRQVLPPVLVLSMAGAVGLGFVNPIFFGWIGLYLTAVFAVSVTARFETESNAIPEFNRVSIIKSPSIPLFQRGKSRPPFSVRMLVFPAFVIMHVAWGLGFWAGLFMKRGRRKNSRIQEWGT